MKARHRRGVPAAVTSAFVRPFSKPMVELDLAPHQFTIVSGIGQSGKFPHYVQVQYL